MIFGFVKTELDIHTLGLTTVSQLVEKAGYKSFISDEIIVKAISNIQVESNFQIFKKWIVDNKITHLGFSYRLDPKQALNSFGKLLFRINADKDINIVNGQIKHLSFAGLPEACYLIERNFGKQISTFSGDENSYSTLLKLGIPEKNISSDTKYNSKYDELRLRFGKWLIDNEKQFNIKPVSFENRYPEFGTKKDSLEKRILWAKRTRNLPLTRVHVGPYLENRIESLLLFSDWLKELNKGKLLDVVSIGSSQLSQSHFGKLWEGLENGGGVPFNSELELKIIGDNARPMLTRAYSGTNNVSDYAKMLDRNINNTWHALSLWWFNKLDGRGPLNLLDNLKQHFKTISYLASINKPFEPNISHHFSFRGGDDITYVISSFLAIKAAKLLGVKQVVLQNMLNTPKSTSGINDLVKSRSLLKLAKALCNNHFTVYYQPRAGLDYFSPEIQKAQIQLSAVTALMSDVDPLNNQSIDIIHVVNYSEALFLATPQVINDSLKITKATLHYYPEFRKKNNIWDIILSKEISLKEEELIENCLTIINDIESNISDLYTPEGFFKVFQKGYFPVPYLWGECRDEFSNATKWKTNIIDGGVCIVDEHNKKISTKARLDMIKGN